jgi:hypothetical protein
MYIPRIIDNSDPGKPVYEQRIHNQRLCVQCRFPYLEDMFIYENGQIVGVHEDFKWKATGQGVEFLTWFIIRLASTSEKNNVARITNPNDFVSNITQIRNEMNL